MITLEHIHDHLLQIISNQEDIKFMQGEIMRTLTNYHDRELDKVIKSLKHTLKDLNRTPTK